MGKGAQRRAHINCLAIFQCLAIAVPGIWQRRYWEHTIRDDADIERHIDYIHPVKHQLISQVVDWPYSSFHRYVERGLLPADWGGDLMDMRGRFGE